MKLAFSPIGTFPTLRAALLVTAFCIPNHAYSQQAGSTAAANVPVTAADQQKQQADQELRAKLNAMLAERAQEEEAEKQRREEANQKTKQHVEAAKKKTKKK